MSDPDSYCRECDLRFDAWVDCCSDCLGPLTDGSGVPREAAPVIRVGYTDLVCVYRASNLMLAEMIADRLRVADVPAAVRDLHTHMLFGGWFPFASPPQVLVPVEFANRAREVLAEERGVAG